MLWYSIARVECILGLIVSVRSITQESISQFLGRTFANGPSISNLHFLNNYTRLLDRLKYEKEIELA